MKLATINRWLRPLGFVLVVDVGEWVKFSFASAKKHPLVDHPRVWMCGCGDENTRAIKACATCGGERPW